MPAIKINQY